MQFIQSVRQATRADWGASVPGWIQETFILLFSLGTMCWSREAALLGRLSCAYKHRKNPTLTDTIWTFTTVVLCLGAQMHKATALQSSSYYKTAPTWKEKNARSLPLWLRCVSIYFLCCFINIIKNEKEMLTQSKESFMKQITRSRCNELYTVQYLCTCAYVRLYVHVLTNVFWTHDATWKRKCLDITFFLHEQYKQSPLWLIP